MAEEEKDFKKQTKDDDIFEETKEGDEKIELPEI
jgi:hypothetical protein